MNKLGVVTFVKFGLVFCFTLFLFGCNPKNRKTASSVYQPGLADRPNIIFILADDVGYNDLGCYGQSKFQTPNIDTISENGIRFTQFYAGASVCAPSRCALMTGKHMGHATVRHNQKNGDDLKPGETTIGSVLKSAGYNTAIIGKWGIGYNPAPNSPNTHGFDYAFGYINMWHAHNFYPEFLLRNGDTVPLKNKVKHVPGHTHYPNLVGWAYERHEYTHDLFSDDAIRYVMQQTEPYLLYLAYTIPHENGEAKHFNKDDLFEIPDLGSYKDKEWTRREKGKAAMMERMDRDIGRLIEALKTTGQYENTLICFTSDNGANNSWSLFESNYPFRGGKRAFYEGGIRVPFVAQWPGKIKPGQTTNHIAAFWDVLKTLAEVGGVDTIPETDGISFLPTLLDHKEQKEHDYLYWEWPENNEFKQAVRLGEWKAIRRFNVEKLKDTNYLPEFELYNLKSDTSESRNVTNEHPDIVRQLKDKMNEAHVDAYKINISGLTK